jgi:protein tyrosine kinase modulator
MDLGQILYALRARWLVALLVMVATMGAVVGVTLDLPKQYTATTSLVVDMRSPEPMAALLAAGNMATQVAIVESDRVAQRVVKLLKLDESPAIREQWATQARGKGDVSAWVASLLQRRLTARPLQESIIEISYTASDPEFAAAVANAFAQAYTDTLVSLKAGPATQYARWFAGQTRALRAELEEAQARLSSYQQETGIVVTDDRMDAETARLNQLNRQLTVIQGQTADAQSRQRTGSAAAALPATAGMLGGDMLQQLRSQIDQKEVELRDAAVNLGANHPKYRSLEAQLDELKQKLDAETRHITNSFSVAKSVSLGTESELKVAIAAQRKKLLDLKDKRDRLDILKRDVDRAQAAYDAVASHLTQTSLDSRATETNVAVLSAAVAPSVPSWPKPLRVMAALGAVLGVVLGIGVALLLEMIDRRIRSPEDLALMLQLPVLGVIESTRKRTMYLPRHRSAPLLR